MAESIAILFKDVKWNDLVPAISDFAEHISSLDWRYPQNNDEYTISLYEYDSWVNECEDEDVDIFYSELNDFPTCTLCIELRRSKQNQACEDAIKISNLLLSQFKGIVDDSLGEFWKFEQIKSNNEFLAKYKY